MTIHIDEQLVRSLIRQQFPKFSDLPIHAVAKQGWDNRTFRLGGDLAVRMPSEESYAPAVNKEVTALATLEPHLSVAVPKVFALGQPSDAYPLPWSIRHWLGGETLEDAPPNNKIAFATQLATVLIELRSAPPAAALAAGEHSFYRGCHPRIYENEVVKSLEILKQNIDSAQSMRIWQAAIKGDWCHEPVWFHGDIAVGNILMQNSEISALIDFGTCGVGDPACDYAVAWTYFNAVERAHFKHTLQVDDDTWQRAKAWALWKSLATLAGLSSPDQNGVQAHALQEILREQQI